MNTAQVRLRGPRVQTIVVNNDYGDGEGGEGKGEPVPLTVLNY